MKALAFIFMLFDAVAAAVNAWYFAAEGNPLSLAAVVFCSLLCLWQMGMYFEAGRER